MHQDTKANFTVPDTWISTFTKRCPNVDKTKLDPETVNFNKLMQSLQIIGSYLGNVVEQKLMDSRHFNHFNDTSFAVSTQRILLCFIFMMPA